MTDEAPTTPTTPTRLDDVPNDVLVTIFSLVDDQRWVRETFPLIAKAFRDLYRSQGAGPLHEKLVLDAGVDSGQRAIEWASRYASDAKELIIRGGDGGGGGLGRVPESITKTTTGDLAALVGVLGRSLVQVTIEEGCGSLLEAPFWATLRALAFPGQLRSLAISGIQKPLSSRDVLPVWSIKSLETLTLRCGSWTSYGSSPGLRDFPASLPALSNLRHLVLSGHHNLREIPAGVSSLTKLQSLTVSDCSLQTLFIGVGSLSNLTSLNISGNHFEIASLPGMVSLRVLSLRSCGLRTVPMVAGSFPSLQELYLGGNRLGLGGGFPGDFAAALRLTTLELSNNSFSSAPPALLSMSQLSSLDLSQNNLTSLPENFGQHLCRLKNINLSSCKIAAVPCAALVGATALEVISLEDNASLKIDTPLDFLVDNFPRLRLLKMWKRGDHVWSGTSTAHIADFIAKLRMKNSAVRLEILPPGGDGTGDDRYGYDNRFVYDNSYIY